MSTNNYIVQVDSSYRDLNQYTNQADFAVSFQTNTTTDFQVQGLPISPSGYFLNASIDPDFKDNNLRCSNGIITDYKQYDINIFISGIANRSPFYLYDKNNILVSLTGFTNSIPYLCKLTQNLDNSFSYNWMTNATGTFTNSNYTGVPNKVISEITEQGGIYWMFNFTYDILNINYLNASGTNSTIFNITSQRNPNTVQNFITAFDYEGNIFFVNNHPYGYHVVSSTWSLDSLQPYYNYNMVLSQSQDIYMTTNLNKNQLLSYGISLTGTKTGPTGSNIIWFDNGTTGGYIITGSWTGTFVQSGTGATITYGPPVPSATINGAIVSFSMTNMQFRINNGKQYMIVPYGNSRAGANGLSAGLYIYVCNDPAISLSFDFLFDISLQSYFPWPTFELAWSEFQTILGVDYFIVSVLGNSNNYGYPIVIFKYDYLGGRLDYVSQTELYLSNATMFTTVYNNILYICVRKPFGLCYVIKFDPATNLTTTLNTILLPSGTSFARGYVLGGFLDSVNAKIYFFAANRTTSANLTTPAYSIEYNINTNAINIISNFLVSGSVSVSTTLKLQNKFLLCSSWTTYSQCPIYDVTNPFSVTKIYETLAIPTFSSFVLTTYNNDDILIAGNYVYNVTNLNNIKNILQINNPPYAVDNYNCLIGVNPNIINLPGTIQTQILTRSLFISASTIFYSSHYFFNYQNLLNTSSYNLTGALFNQNNLTCTDGSYGEVKLFTANDLQVDVFTSTNFVYPILQTILYLPVQQAQIPRNMSTVSYLINGDYIYFLSVVYPNQCYIYVGKNNGTTWSLVNTILPSNYSVTGNTVGAASLIITPLANTPGVYCVVFDNNGYVRKYQYDLINLTNFTQVNQVFPYTNVASQNILGSCIGYYSNYNEYAVISLRSLSASRNMTLFVTEPTQLTVNSSTGTFPGTNYSQQFLYNPFINTYIVGWRGALLTTDYTYLFNFNVPTNTTTLQFIQTFAANPPNYRPFFMWIDNLYSKMYLAVIAFNAATGNSILKIFDITNPLKEQPLLYSNDLSGNVINMTGFTVGTRTVLAMLFTNGTLFTYEVSNVLFCASYPFPQTITYNYSNIQMLSGSFVHNINYEGIPNWLNVIGSSFVYNGNNVFTSSLTQDQNYLYISGSMNNAIELFSTFYNTTGTTGTLVGYYPANQIITNTINTSSFIAKCNKNSGKWEWCTPLIGTNNCNIISNLSLDSQILIGGYYDSSNLFLYYPQISNNATGPFTFTSLGIFQEFFNNNNFTSGLLISINNDGIFNWRSVLYGETSNNNTYIYTITEDSIDTEDSRILIGGISTATKLKCTDSSYLNTQDLYSNLMTVNQQYIFCYEYTFTGSYLQSENIILSPGSIGYLYGLRSFSENDNVIWLNNIFNNSSKTGSYSSFNKDGTLASIGYTPLNSLNGILSTYKYNSIYIDTNGLEYSRLLIYNFTGPNEGSLIKNNSFILGQPADITVNKNFVIRNNTYDPLTGQLIIILNEVIDLKETIKYFSTTNGIPLSEYYRSVNLSVSPLVGVAYYNNATQVGNNITFSDIYGNIPINTTQQYYLSIPQINTGSTGIYTSIIPITSITQNVVTKLYTVTLQDINQLRVPSPSGSLYGPHIYLCANNYSAFYTLQFYPGALNAPQTYILELNELILPNRPIQNSIYPGLQTLAKYPYIYLVIYNADNQDNFDPAIINSVYDNNVNIPKFAIFQLSTSVFSGNTADYVSLSSSLMPKIRFVPGYYKLKFKIVDNLGNVIFFDNTPYKDTDDIFTDVVPDSLLNVVVKLTFTKV